MAEIFTKESIARLIASALGFEPTSGQEEAMEALSCFIIRFREKVGFVLKGYAGTGKTTLISALVRTLPQLKITPVLLAPTGRAAKVLGLYSGVQAYTIHKYIYYAGLDESGVFRMSLRKNQLRNTLFIVDEASMMSATDSLLKDLFRFVYSGFQCRLLFLGDTAQLPPVGSTHSPALEKDFLESCFGVDFLQAQLKQVLRQKSISDILENATQLRIRLAEEKYTLPVFCPVRDLVRLTDSDFEDTLQSAYAGRSKEDIVFITRSNKRANWFNKAVRNRVFGLEEELSAGDLLMVVRNNYYWTESLSKIGFLANGDMIEVLKVRHYQDIYGFRFADIEARLPDYPSEPNLELKVCLDSLHTQGPSLSYEQNKMLWDAVSQDYASILLKGQRIAAIKKDPYVNALQVKYAYALTCHKTQGGQWPLVFIDLGYFTDEMLGEDFFRWLYTALTRGMEKVYLVGFGPEWISLHVLK